MSIHEISSPHSSVHPPHLFSSPPPKQQPIAFPMIDANDPLAHADDPPLYASSPGPTYLPGTCPAVSASYNPKGPILGFPRGAKNSFATPSPVECQQQQIVHTFFSAVSQKQPEVVTEMISSGLVTSSTTDFFGQTPLIAAVAADDVHMVETLAVLGADVNQLGQYLSDLGADRTPLMAAAQRGNLSMVKLLMDVWHADDAIVSADGQMALRLAVEKGHGDVVRFLPRRRGGGWKRWKTQHAKALKRSEKALKRIARFVTIACWHLPKFLLWTIPTELLVKPIKKGLMWCWMHQAEFRTWCKSQAVKVVEWFCGGWKQTVADLATETWKFATQGLPKLLKNFAKYFWSLLTVRIPAAIRAVMQWLWQGVKIIGHSLWSAMQRLASLLHTTIIAVFSFFRKLTMKDIWNAISDVLRIVLMDLPLNVWKFVQQFGQVLYQVVEKVAGSFGSFMWWIGRGLVGIVAYLPRKIWVVISSLGGSMVQGVRELLIWIDPKV